MQTKRAEQHLINRVDGKKIIENANVVDYDNMTLEQIESNINQVIDQAHILTGRLLLAAKKIIGDNLQEFGKWRVEKFGDRLSQASAHNMMQLAAFFTPERPLNNIPPSGGYLIAKEKYKDYAVTIYDQLKDKEVVKINDVKKVISEVVPTVPAIKLTRQPKTVDERDVEMMAAWLQVNLSPSALAQFIVDHYSIKKLNKMDFEQYMNIKESDADDDTIESSAPAPVKPKKSSKK